MRFLEAHKIVTSFGGGPALPFLLAMSGTPEPLEMYLKAAAAKRGYAAQARTLPFNTLGQELSRGPQSNEEREAFLLMPWDLAPELDWRSGLPAAECSFEEIRERALGVAEQLRRRPRARFVYLPAPGLPIFADAAQNGRLAATLASLAASLQASILPAQAFSLNAYVSTGCPVGGTALGDVAEEIVAALLQGSQEPCKVLATDLDNVMWAGLLAEEGVRGVGIAPEGVTYRHFLYQTFVAKLRREGVLLCAVSRNDADLPVAAFRSGRMVLKEEDFVVLIGSYNAKSAQIRDIAERLNLSLKSFVFVDDNPVELAEVSSQLPEVHCVRFPEKDDEAPAFFERLTSLFGKASVTREDRQRTEMYRTRLQGMVPSSMQGADLTAFLRDLKMTLSIQDRSQGDRTRAVQLINKTNQFNLNGRRVTDEEVAAEVAGGGKLWTASLNDRYGSHGEILSCLVSSDGAVKSFVMSCRVFQRRVEHAFLSWLALEGKSPTHFEFASTERNQPLRQFVSDPAFCEAGRSLSFDGARFAADHGKDLDLFELKVEVNA